jgi:hypothetical protein
MLAKTVPVFPYWVKLSLKTTKAEAFSTSALAQVVTFDSVINQFLQNNFLHRCSDTIHHFCPLKMIFGFQLFCYALNLYQLKKGCSAIAFA